MSCDDVGELATADGDGEHRTAVYACCDCPGQPLVLNPDAHQHAHHPAPGDTSPEGPR